LPKTEIKGVGELEYLDEAVRIGQKPITHLFIRFKASLTKHPPERESSKLAMMGRNHSLLVHAGKH